MSTRAASGSESQESGLGPGPGPGPRRAGKACEKLGESKKLEPSDGSSSRCLEKGYGKRLKSAPRPLLNFCKRLVRLKEKPSNCPPCPEIKPEESFWDYLFKFEDKKIPEPETCRVAQRQREACRRTDPRLCDRRYRRTDGDVLLFTETEKPRCSKAGEMQPKSPPGYRPPKAVTFRRITEVASSSHPIFRPEAETEGEGNNELRCSGPRSFRIPFEECRPPRKPREPFSCDRGAKSANVAPPISITRGTCGGRSVGEYIAEATIDRVKSETTLGRVQMAVDRKCEPAVDVKNRSRIQRLQQLTEHANNCVKETGRTSTCNKSNDEQNVTTESHSPRKRK